MKKPGGCMAFPSRIHRRRHIIAIFFLWTLLAIFFHHYNSDGSKKERIRKEDDKCPPVSPLLNGWTDVSNYTRNALSYSGRWPLGLGGSYQPVECRTNRKLAVVVPYRNRNSQLDIFLRYLHPFLQRQQLDYTIFVVEQTGKLTNPFNRGMLMNIGFTEALRLRSFDCFVFHDVDLLPEDDRNSYACPEVGEPRHLSVAINTFGYRPIGPNHFGGVCSITTVDFVAVNGFSNKFWGWGGEDDDLFDRLRSKNMTVRRHRPLRQTRYTMLPHDTAKPNPDRKRILQEKKMNVSKAMMADGLISLKYRILDLQFQSLSTHIVVEILRSYGDSLTNSSL